MYLGAQVTPAAPFPAFMPQYTEQPAARLFCASSIDAAVPWFQEGQKPASKCSTKSDGPKINQEVQNANEPTRMPF